MFRTRGFNLPPKLQDEAKRRFLNRYTGDHVPYWAPAPREDGQPWAMQFASDAEWFDNTRFWLNSNKNLLKMPCESKPTWPLNPELEAAEALLRAQFFGEENYYIRFETD